MALKIKDELNNNEIELLMKNNIIIEDKEYTIDDTGDIIEKLDAAIQNSLDKNLNFTEKSVELENLQAKILKLEDKID
jgi:hypothetical protein